MLYWILWLLWSASIFNDHLLTNVTRNLGVAAFTDNPTTTRYADGPKDSGLAALKFTLHLIKGVKSCLLHLMPIEKPELGRVSSDNSWMAPREPSQGLPEVPSSASARVES